MGILDEHIWNSLMGSEIEKKLAITLDRSLSMQASDDSLPKTYELFIAPYQVDDWSALLLSRKKSQQICWDAQQEWQIKNPRREYENNMVYQYRTLMSIPDEVSKHLDLFLDISDSIIESKQLIFKDLAPKLKKFILQMRAITELKLVSDNYIIYNKEKDKIKLESTDLQKAYHDNLTGLIKLHSEVQENLGSLYACQLIDEYAKNFRNTIVHPLIDVGVQVDIKNDTFIGLCNERKTKTIDEFLEQYNKATGISPKNIQKSPSVFFTVHGLLRGEYGVYTDTPNVILKSATKNYAKEDFAVSSPSAIRIQMPSTHDNYATEFMKVLTDRYEERIIPKDRLQREPNNL